MRVNVLPAPAWEAAVARLPKKHREVVERDRQALVALVVATEDRELYWRRRASDAQAALRDRERYIRQLEKELRPNLTRRIDEAEAR